MLPGDDLGPRQGGEVIGTRQLILLVGPGIDHRPHLREIAVALGVDADRLDVDRPADLPPNT